MLSGDDLRKQLTAAEAFNRFMEKRVRFLELENRMLQAAAYKASPSSASDVAATGDTPGGDKKQRDPTMMTAAQVLDELIRLRSDHKTALGDIKSLKKELTITTANLEHYTAKEAQQRHKSLQLAEEVRQLRSLLPAHLFDLGSGPGPSGGSGLLTPRGFRSEAKETESQRGISALSVAGEIRTSSSSLRNPNAPDCTPVSTSSAPPAFLGENDANATALRQHVELCCQAAKAMEQEAAEAASGIFSMPQLPFELLPPSSWLTSLPASGATSAAVVAVMDLSSPAARLPAWHRLSGRLHSVLKFSKRDLVDAATLTAAWSAGAVAAAVDQSETSMTPRSGKSQQVPSGPKKLVDRTQLQAESFLSLVEQSVDHVKRFVMELPKSVSQYLLRCRSGVTLIVEGQRATMSLASLATVQTQAIVLAADLRGARESYQSSMNQLQQALAALCMVLMHCVDASVGLATYRHLPGLVAQALKLESHVAGVLRLDATLEADILAATFHMGLQQNDQQGSPSSSSDPSGLKSSSGEDGTSKWYVTGVELETEVVRLAEMDPKSDRIEKLDIMRIKKLFPDALSSAASIASTGALTQVAAQCITALETIRGTAVFMQKVIRGQVSGLIQMDSVLSGNASPGQDGALSSQTAGASNAVEPVQHRGTQCNLQQQKLQMTDNELHIARLASIRSNWFEAAASTASTAVGDTTGESASGGSPSGSPFSISSRRDTTPNRTPRPGRTTSDDVARLVGDYVRRLPQLQLPANFAPLADDVHHRRSQRLKSTNHVDGFPWLFGRKVVYLNITGGGSKLAVHIGGGYITFEEFCFKYGPGEAMMMGRKEGGAASGRTRGGGAQSPSGTPSVVNIDSDAIMAVSQADGGRHTVPSLKSAMRRTLQLAHEAGSL